MFRWVRIFAALFYLGLLFSGAAWLANRHLVFDGLVAVAVGGRESLAVRPAGEGAGFTLSPHRGLSPDLLPFDNPAAARRLFPASGRFDAEGLGFALELRRAEVMERLPDLEVIEARAAGAAPVETPAAPGQAVAAPGGPATVLEVGPWAGIIAESGGRPLAALSWRSAPDAPWIQGVFLEEGRWTFLTPEAAFHLHWAADEAAAEAALPETPPGLDAARWGVRDVRRVHWFQSFEPGTACTISDGAEYVLLRRPEEGAPVPALRVGVRKGEEKRVLEVSANAAGADDPVLFEYPGALPVRVLVRPWREGSAWVAAWRGDGRLPPARMKEGDILDLGGGAALRLDGAAPAAVPVGTTGNPVQAALLRTHTGTLLRLREGLLLREGGVSWRYRRLPQPPRMRYTLARDGAEHVLEPGGAVTLGPWTFAQTDDNLAAEKTALLRARRTWGGPLGQVAVGLLVTGALGWAVTGMRRRDKRALPPLSPPQEEATSPRDAPE